MFVSLASPLHKACCTLLGIFSRLHPRKIWKESAVLKQIYHLWKCEERGWLGGWRWGGVISQPIKCKRRAGESRQGICSLSLVWLPTEPRRKAQEDFQISPPSGKRKPSLESLTRETPNIEQRDILHDTIWRLQNKNESPSRDALDKTENYANCQIM